MEHKYETPLIPFAFTSNTSWRNQLRQSVRLYLAMGSLPVNAQELENHLRRTEEELIHYLLEGTAPTAAAVAHAQTILDMAQTALLNSEEEVQQLLSELAAEQAAAPQQ